jgi:hypothetical protein
LFSREDVARVVNRDFEAAWESVRPVPIIRIDFGNGRVVIRTLHGNVASHVCAPDGQVLDILPGIYTPAVYAAALGQLHTLAGTIGQPGGARQDRLRGFHCDIAAETQRSASPDRLSAPGGRSAGTACQWPG